MKYVWVVIRYHLSMDADKVVGPWYFSSKPTKQDLQKYCGSDDDIATTFEITREKLVF